MLLSGSPSTATISANFPGVIEPIESALQDSTELFALAKSEVLPLDGFFALNPASVYAVAYLIQRSILMATFFAVMALMGASVAVALVGIFVAWLFYVKNPALPRSLGAALQGLYRTLYRKWYIDEVYDALVVRPLMALSNFLWRVWDVLIVDGIVNAVGAVVVGTGAVLRLFQSGYVGTYAFFLVLGVLILLASAVAAVAR